MASIKESGLGITLWLESSGAPDDLGGARYHPHGWIRPVLPDDLGGRFRWRKVSSPWLETSSTLDGLGGARYHPHGWIRLAL